MFYSRNFQQKLIKCCLMHNVFVLFGLNSTIRCYKCSLRQITIQIAIVISWYLTVLVLSFIISECIVISGFWPFNPICNVQASRYLRVCDERRRHRLRRRPWRVDRSDDPSQRRQNYSRHSERRRCSLLRNPR